MKWLVLLFLVSCAQVASLNLKKHQFGIVPTKIIWFQVAGLEEEHLAMLRFQYSGDRKTAFELNNCIGKSWSYNLFDLRTRSQASFLSQITGKKNITMTCSDAELRPVWSYLESNGYVTGILEMGANKDQSLISLNQCGEKGLNFLSNLYVWLRQEPVPKAETFHYAESIMLKQNQLMYDRTCSNKGCASSITDDIKSIYQQFQKLSGKHLMIVRDFSYLDALQKRDFIKARSILSDLERGYGEMVALTKDNDYLVLLTTAESKMVDMPDQGKAWYDFEKNGSNVQLKRTQLTNLILASGSRSENFCGIYDDTEVFERILSGPKQQGLELKVINPFK